MSDADAIPDTRSRSASRARWLWVTVGVVILVVGSIVLGNVVSVLSRSSASPEEIHQQLVDQIEETKGVAGGEPWGWPDDATGTTIPWTHQRALKNMPGPCSGSSDGPVRFDEWIFGPGDPDPAAAIARMTKHWQGLGYTVRTVVPTNSTPSHDSEIAVDFPQGAGLGYFVSTEISSVQGTSECFHEKADE